MFGHTACEGGGRVVFILYVRLDNPNEIFLPPKAQTHGRCYADTGLTGYRHPMAPFRIRTAL